MQNIVELLNLLEENIIILSVILVISYIIYSTALYFIFYKINEKPYKGLIPIYNIVKLLNLIDIPVWMILLYLIPYVNIVGIPFMSIVIALNLRKNLNLNSLLTLGLMILPPLFIIFVAMKNLSYNKIEHNAKLIKDKVIIVKEDNIIDLPSLNIDISNVSNVEAFDATNFVSNKDNFVTKKIEEQQDIPNEVASLTYDYDKMYNQDNK